MHYSRARSLPLDGRYHSPVDEAAGCEPRADALGTTAAASSTGLCINYTYRTVSRALTYTKNTYITLNAINE